MLVYMIQFPNNKKYIGITSETLESRQKRHYLACVSKKKHPVHLAMISFGIGSETWSVISHCTSWEECCQQEKHYIQKYNTFIDNQNGYNCTLGGEGACVWSDEELIMIAQKYKTKGEWQKSDPVPYNIAWKRGLIPKCSEHMISKKINLSFEEVTAIAESCESYKQFRTLHPRVFSYASHKGWAKNILTDKRGHKKHTKESLQAIFNKYDRIWHLQKEDGAAYKAAEYRGWLDELSQHMKKDYHKKTKRKNIPKTKNKKRKQHQSTKPFFIENTLCMGLRDAELKFSISQTTIQQWVKKPHLMQKYNIRFATKEECEALGYEVSHLHCYNT